MPIYALGDFEPVIDPTAFVHPDAVIIGNVTIGAEASIWPCAVLRGDSGAIRVGAATSIQDGAIIHCTAELDTSIGDRCVVGHAAHIEGATVHDDALVGSASVLLHRVVVHSGALVAAGAVVSPGTEVPTNAMALGVPARIKPDATSTEAFASNVANYLEAARLYPSALRRID